MRPFWLNKTESTKTRATKKEHKYAKELGGRCVAGSGNSWSHKGDIRVDGALIELKTTDKDRLVLHEDYLSKIFYESTKSKRDPYLIVEFSGYRLVGKVEKR